MGSSQSRLSPLQRELLDAFFALEQKFALTGGSALGGFHLGHRESLDLDLFSHEPADLDQATSVLGTAARRIGATVESQVSYPEFRRLLVRRGPESTLVDLVIDRAPEIDDQKLVVGRIRIDSMREIAANKVCTLIGRAEIRDLIDLRALIEAGIDLESAITDARRKDGGVNAATLAWLLGDLRIPADARLPGSVDPVELDRFRDGLVQRLLELALPDRRE
ncbi:MAG: nucleotidyl transferase AbiEii/AbiGii toxin family protein [Planctomycetes bacterium]|nr:nucleotidyl transferase AbiEii/AbiGii toxin family protein [Planctomycetota bacterium]